MKLYRVKSAGLGTHYVVADDTDEAYQMLRNEWDQKNYGFDSDRELVSVELLAEERSYHNSRTVLRVSRRN